MIEALPFAMLATLAALLFSGLPVAFLLAGVGVAFCLIGVAIGEMPLIALYNIPPKLAAGLQGSLFYPAVVMLLFMGAALEKSEIAHDMLTCLRLLLSRVRGGLVLAVLLIGVLLAPAAGIVGASVVTLSLIALPTLLRAGYTPETAAGSVAAAGTVGVILPPAVMLFILAGEFQAPIGSLFMSTVIPGFGLVFLYGLFYAARGGGGGLQGQDPDRPASAAQWAILILRGLVAPFALVLLVLGAIIFGWATPSQSGAIGAAGGLALAVFSGRFSWTMLREIVEVTTRLSGMVFLIIMSAAVFSFAFRYFGGDTAIADGLEALALGPWGMLAVILGIIFILGFFVDWIEIAVITLPLFMPVLQGLDFGDHVGAANKMLWIAAVTALVFQTSFITPPFGFALFFLKGAAPPEVTLARIYRGIVPILIIQLIVIALALAAPALVTWLPEQVYGAIRG